MAHSRPNAFVDTTGRALVSQVQDASSALRADPLWSRQIREAVRLGLGVSGVDQYALMPRLYRRSQPITGVAPPALVAAPGD